METFAGSRMPVPDGFFLSDTEAAMKKIRETLDAKKAGVFRVRTAAANEPAISIVEIMIPALRPRRTPLVLRPLARSPSMSARVVERCTAATARG